MFPTSLESDGSDAIHPDPDYSAVYVTLNTDDGHAGQKLIHMSVHKMLSIFPPLNRRY